MPKPRVPPKPSIIRAARAAYARDGKVRIDPFAAVDADHEGAWVAAWVRVDFHASDAGG